MPIHDWSRVDSGIFHHLHLGWIARLNERLNGGLLPEPYYALAEPVLGEAMPDVISLRARGAGESPAGAPEGLRHEDATTPAVQGAPTSVMVQELPPLDPYASLARRIVVKDALRGDSVVAVIELVSRGNKTSQRDRDRFLDKTLELHRGRIHVLLVDVQPTSGLLPRGFHGLNCEAHGQSALEVPRGRPLQVVAYEVLETGAVRSHPVPLAIGDALPDMPLFVLPQRFVPLPLEPTYMEAFQGLPRRFRDILEGPIAS